jgi:hypothetical protein
MVDIVEADHDDNFLGIFMILLLFVSCLMAL